MSEEKKYDPCGGCGADHPSQQCIGCRHPFREITSRPIPEGVKPPEGCVILGWGGTFKSTGCFEGWKMWPSEGRIWHYGDMIGKKEFVIYAADRDSEVARLNTKPGWFAEAMKEIMQDPKDALIRELVGALEFYSNEWHHGAIGWEPTDDLREDQGQEANRVLTLARTTCPELFKDND